MEFYSKTDIGKVRTTNQDAVNIRKISDNLIWSVVCDGMGGTNGGDIASHTAVEEITKYLGEHLTEQDDTEKIKETMYTSVQQANSAIFEKAKSTEDLKRMGTTVVLCVISGSILYVVHAGDSRVYLVGKSKIKQLTKDHSIVQEMLDNSQITPREAKNHPQKNIITRALGVNVDIKLDYNEVKLKEGDIVLSCTDGLTNHLSEREIYKICSQNDFSLVADKLVSEGNKRGGSDNITVSVIKC